jgi:hypothetical protein
MSRYKESLQKTPEHIPLSKCEQIKMDLSGLIRYAKEQGVSPFELSAEEKERFIKRN